MVLIKLQCARRSSIMRDPPVATPPHLEYQDRAGHASILTDTIRSGDRGRRQMGEGGPSQDAADTIASQNPLIAAYSDVGVSGLVLSLVVDSSSSPIAPVLRSCPQTGQIVPLRSTLLESMLPAELGVRFQLLVPHFSQIKRAGILFSFGFGSFPGSFKAPHQTNQLRESSLKCFVASSWRWGEVGPSSRYVRHSLSSC